MPLQLLTPPASEPLSLEEVRAFLRLDHDADDAVLIEFTNAARELCEKFTATSLIEQSWRLEARLSRQGAIELPRGPLIGVDAVRLGSAQTLLSDQDYVVEQRQFAVRLTVSKCAPGEKIEIDYRAGYGADWNAVPLGLRQGMLRLIAHQYRFRDDPQAPALPTAVAALWAPYRSLRL